MKEGFPAAVYAGNRYGPGICGPPRAGACGPSEWICLVWAAHHLLVSPVQMLQPMPLLARLIPEAEGMVIGPNIIILPLLNPVHVAEEGATMDLMSDGNFVLGVGQGYRDEEFGSFGISPRDRVGRFEGMRLLSGCGVKTG